MLPIAMASMLGPALTGGAASIPAAGGLAAGASGLFSTLGSMFGPVSSMLGGGGGVLGKKADSDKVSAVSGIRDTGAMIVTTGGAKADSKWIFIVVGVGLLALVLKRK